MTRLREGSGLPLSLGGAARSASIDSRMERVGGAVAVVGASALAGCTETARPLARPRASVSRRASRLAPRLDTRCRRRAEAVVASASSSRPRARLANIPDGGGAREVAERLPLLGHAGVNAADLLVIR